jgi:signal peptidase I
MMARSHRTVHPRRWTLWQVLLLVSALAVCLIAAVVAVSVRLFVVSSDTLFPALRAEDIVLVETFTYRHREPRRGEIIILSTTLLQHPSIPHENFYVKRIAGLPHETVELAPPDFLINGQPLRQPPIFRDIIERRHPAYHGYVLPEAHFPQPPALRLPHVSLTLRRDEFLVLGDNSRDSLDSRYFGPVPRHAILGRVVWRIWPFHRFGPPP